MTPIRETIHKFTKERPEMKKTALIAIALVLLAFSPLQAQDPANDEYIKAMTSNDMAQRVKLLKEWLNKYGSTGHQYENFANATICTAQYTGKTAADAIQYGEKALSIGGLDDSTKAQVLVTLSSVYLQQDPSKARKYANQLIQTSTTAKGQKAQEGRAQIWNQLIGAGHFIQAEAYKKENNPKSALDAYLKSYNILKSKEAPPWEISGASPCMPKPSTAPARRPRPSNTTSSHTRNGRPAKWPTTSAS
jgi:hypothetical protein